MKNASPNLAQPIPLRILAPELPVPYARAYEQQLELRDAVARGDTPDTLFLLEHTPVVTFGRKSSPEHLLVTPAALKKDGIDLCETDRGGDVTWHGPGQLVAYPILNLNRWKKSISWYLRTLEETIIQTLMKFSVHGERLKGHTGVWVEGAKVAAVGVGIRDWTTYHGIAINVDSDMNQWNLIIPCGIADKPVTSMRMLLGKDCPTLPKTAEAFSAAFCEIFGTTPLG